MIKFISVQDANEAYDWISDFLDTEHADANKHDDPEQVKAEVDEIRELLTTVLEQIENIGSIEKVDYEIVEDIWDRVLLLNEETYFRQQEPETISWGVWRVNKKQIFDFGYTKETIHSVVVPANSDHKIHTYKQYPPKIHWKLNKIVQKDLTFFTASARVDEIEQVSSVPALPVYMTSIEAGLRVLDSKRGENEWQRRPMPKRIQSITEFVELDDNIIANAPILFIKDERSAEIIDDELIIDFRKFLVEIDNKNLLTDHVTSRLSNYDSQFEYEYKDLRPLWLIDGQHRVRGLSRSAKGASLNIPIIILPANFSLARSAKLFSEINTLQESLKPLHKLFMQHRFGIPSPNKKRDFRNWSEGKGMNIDSRANHFSYEILAMLASRDDSPLLNKVRILEQNDSNDYYVKADQWVNYARSWFLHGPYDNSSIWTRDRIEDVYTEVRNYFKAFINTVNHGKWSDKKLRWPSSTKNRSLLQSSTHFKVLIDLFSDVYDMLPNKNGHLYEIDDFMKVMIPFRWVDWIHQGLKKQFGGGGEKGRSSLYIWMSDALQARESFGLSSVMSDKIKSQPGKGILAPPASPELKYIGKWPKKGEPVRIISERPFNARKKPTWHIEDELKTSYDILKIQSSNECILEYAPFIDDVKRFKVTVYWSNASSIYGSSSIIVSNPYY